ncbi:MAG TPA: VOC family protein [Candidatus Acidoferrum sp.]|nr:VOC family protein [Candidatus Acidoferrum sp.]
MRYAPNSLLLELHVPSFEPVKKYYKRLGFKIVWSRERDDAGDYLVLRRENTILCFWPGNESIYKQTYFSRFSKKTKRGYGVEIVIMVHDIDSLYKRAKRFAKVVEKLKGQPWGLKDFRVEDPFGYYIRFTEYHNILSKSNAVS